MTIAIDISSIVYCTGVSIYTQELVKALSKIDKKNRYVLFAGSLRQTAVVKDWFRKAELGENFVLKTFPISPKMQIKIWNDWQMLPLEWLLGEQIDVYHSVDWSLAPTKARTILTVHDLFYLKRPDLQQHPFKEAMERRLRIAKDKKFEVIAVSESTKKDLVELLDYPEELITVVYEAMPGSFKRNIEKNKSKHLNEKFGLKDYLLMVGTLEPRKNLQRTIEAFQQLKASKFEAVEKLELAIAGKVGWGEELLEIEDVKLLGYVANEELPELYVGSKGFLYPSLYEGFGIPLLEALTFGVPVLTSEVSSMPEVAGDAAIYVDPMNVESIRKGIEKMIRLKPTERKASVEKGFKQVKKFSWEKTARETLNIYLNLN